MSSHQERKARPSFSPRKVPQQGLPKQRSLSASRVGSGAVEVEVMPIPSTAALVFDDFSFTTDSGRFPSTRNPGFQKMINYLRVHFNVIDLIHHPPFLSILCEDGLPPEDQRPFSIAGCIAVWMDNEEDYCSFHLDLGERGRGESVDVPDEIMRGLNSGDVPTQEVILWLANNVFKEAEAISYINSKMVIEWPTCDGDQYYEMLCAAPISLKGVKGIIDYHNGPLPQTESNRLVEPNPKLLDSVHDETDYVKTLGHVYPGAMISSVDEKGNIASSVSAGILVQKDGVQRLTSSWHCWEHLVSHGATNLSPEDITKCRVVQGKPGTEIGHVEKVFAPSDVALIKLNDDIRVNNTYLDINAKPRRLLHSDDINIGDEFLIDSFSTGRQQLRCLGRRFSIERRPRARSHPDLFGPDHLLPVDEVAFIRLIQGAFATNAPVITREPRIRSGVCGATLVRCLNKREGRPLDEVIMTGEVTGMTHFHDLRNKYVGCEVMCYCDTFDPLIRDGWEVANTP